MKIIYVIYNEWTIQQKVALQAQGISVEEGYGRIDVEENEKNREVLKLIDEWQLKKFVGTIYDKKDFDKSSLFVYVGVWENGYPQPEDAFGYINLTFDTKRYCDECGIGKVQNAPFRVQKSPKWGEKKFFELNWVFDEIFVRKDVYDSLFRKIGIEAWPVKLYKKETIIEDTVQLKIPKIDVPLLLKDQPFQICKKCGEKKYSPEIKGFFPAFLLPITGLPIFKCSEYFGDGLRANNQIFITKDLLQELRALKVKPTLRPVEAQTYSNV